MMKATSEKIPAHFYTDLSTSKGIEINSTDIFPHILANAKEVAENEYATVEQIENQMRNLYFHPYIYPEIVDTYNKLERKWKVLTKYVERSRSPVLWRED